MDARTRSYLEGRFGDHYRRSDAVLPPAADRREWGFIPWTGGTGTTMVRHRSLLDLGDLGAFLAHQRPRHVYYSAGRYADPSAAHMAGKGWQGSDLIFDLDADHLPSVDPAEDDYKDMLDRCKQELFGLLSLLEDDLGFADPAIAFSGGRGYHVHIRDQSIHELGRRARRDIVDYIRGHGVDLDTVTDTRHVVGSDPRHPTDQRRLDPTGGWSARVHREALAVIDELRSADREHAIERLQGYEGIGERRAESIVAVISSRYEVIRHGNIDVHPAFLRFIAAITDQTVATQGAAIDEPVTTDINRLIRLPHSLHGGSGLRVTPIARDELDAFDPLIDAIPSTFTRTDIAIDVPEAVHTKVGGEARTISSGVQRVPEYVGVHLMATDRARKARESAT